MLRLFDVHTSSGAASPPLSPHAKHHTRSAEEHRLQKDLSELELPPTIKLMFPEGKDHLARFKLSLTPDEGCYKDGTFVFEVAVPDGYPAEPPEVRCLTKVFHPAIDTQGHVDLSNLRDGWRPESGIRAVLYGLNRLFVIPDRDDPLNHDAGALLRSNRAEFERLVAQAVHNGADICGQFYPPARGDETIQVSSPLGRRAMSR